MPWQHTNPSPSLSTTLLEFPLCYYVHGRTKFCGNKEATSVRRRSPSHMWAVSWKGRKKELTPQRNDTVWQTTKYSINTHEKSRLLSHTHHSQSINSSKDVNISSETTALLYTWTTVHILTARPEQLRSHDPGKQRTEPDNCVFLNKLGKTGGTATSGKQSSSQGVGGLQWCGMHTFV